MFFSYIYIYIIEAIVKAEKRHPLELRDFENHMIELQVDTIQAIEEKQIKGHLAQHDVGRRDKREDRTA